MSKPLVKVWFFALIFCLFGWSASLGQWTDSPDGDFMPQTASQGKHHDSGYVTIKVLSGTGDLTPATAMAKHLENLGYEVGAVDLAPRSDFAENTLYFIPSAEPRAKELAADLEISRPVLKNLTWDSRFGIILVVIDTPEKNTSTIEKPLVAESDAFYVKNPSGGETVVGSRSPEAKEDLNIKVLGGNDNIALAKAMAGKIEAMGYERVFVDHAPGPDFKTNAVYFSPGTRDLAERFRKLFEEPSPEPKPLSWESEYDLILIAVSAPPEERAKVFSPEKKPRQDVSSDLRETLNLELSQAHDLFGKRDYAAAREKYRAAGKLVKHIEGQFKNDVSETSSEAGISIINSEKRRNALKNIKFQVLSKNVDLAPAEKAAKHLKKLGFDIHSVDYALRSDLAGNTLYYDPRYENLASEIAFALDEDPYLKPLNWSSAYELILVAGEPAERGRSSWLLEKWAAEEKGIKQQTDQLLAEGASSWTKGESEEAGKKYRQIAFLIKKAVKICEKSILQAEKLALEETLAPSSELKEIAGVSGNKILSLDESVKIALANNPTIKEAEEKLNSAREEKNIARADFFPKGSAEYTYTRLNEEPSINFLGYSFPMGNQKTYEWNASLTQPLFTGFALTSQYKMKELGIKIAEVEKEMTVINVIRDVKTAYFNLLLAKASVIVADEAVNSLESHEKDAQQYYNQGMIPYNDLLKSKVALAHVVQQREKALSAVTITKSALNALMDFKVNREIDAVTEGLRVIPTEACDLATLLHEAVENRPELKMLQLAIKNLDQGIRLVKSAYYPKIAMVGYYEQTGENPAATENDFGAIYASAFMLKAQWDFFEGGKTRSSVAKYQYDKKALMKQYEYAENGIQLEVTKAFSVLQVSEKNIVTSEESLVQAKENWRITDLQYKEQIATSTDVLDARTELTQAESNYYSALYGYMVSLAELERAMGKEVPLSQKKTFPAAE